MNSNKEIKWPFFQYRRIPIYLRLVPLLVLLTGFARGQNNADLYPTRNTGPVSNPHEVPVIGNGDLGAWVQVLSHEVGIHLGKNDAWDSRVEDLAGDIIVPHDVLISSNGERPPGFGSTGRKYVRPKKVGSIRVVHAGNASTGVSSELDISRGLLTATTQFATGILIVEAFISRVNNSVWVKVSAEGTVPGFRLILEKMPDYSETDIPYPVLSEDGGKHIITHTIPGGYGIDAFSWHLAGSFPAVGAAQQVSSVQKMAYAWQQDITLGTDQSIVLSVGVATDRDGTRDSKERAAGLAEPAEPAAFHSARGVHEAEWDKFWAPSGVEMEDKMLEAAWYRTMYLFGIHLRPGAQAPGINANIAIEDLPVFAGLYIWNHNVQKYFMAALPVNHPEWYDVFADLVEQMTPSFEHVAQEMYGLEGVHVTRTSAPFVPFDRTLIQNSRDRGLAHTGWVSQMLFNHYEFMQDKEWLGTRAYPFLKKAAEFYANYMDKYQRPNGDIYASMRFEDHTRTSSGFDKDWTDNTNVAVDLVLIRKAFNAAITASEVLDVDAGLRERWIAALAKVPDIDYGYREGKAWYAISKGWDTKWPDIDEYLDHVRLSRWGSQAWPVFPGELLDGDEETGLAPILREIMAPLDVDNLDSGVVVNFGIMHGEATLPPYVRMGMIEKFPSIRRVIETHQFPSGLLSPYKRAEGMYPDVNQGPPTSWRIHENAYFASLMIVEMMLQSQSAILRFFPFWDRTKAAKFRGMRAKGGFVVSGEFNPATGIKAEILSEAGNPCRIRWREGTKLSVTQDGNPVTLTPQGRDFVFITEARKVYRVNWE